MATRVQNVQNGQFFFFLVVPYVFYTGGFIIQPYSGLRREKARHLYFGKHICSVTETILLRRPSWRLEW